MVPYFAIYLLNHAAAQWVSSCISGVIVFCMLMLSWQQLQPLQIYIYVLALAGGSAFETARDAPGYWAYCGHLLKYYRPQRAARHSGHAWLQLFRRSLPTAAIAIIVTAAGIAVVRVFVRISPAAQAALLLFIWLPVCAAAIATLTGLACTRCAGPHAPLQQARHFDKAEDGTVVHSWRQTLAVDMLPIGIVQAAALWSAYRNPSFSVAEGHDSFTLLVACTILLWLITLFGVINAWRSRLYVITGELMQGASFDLPADAHPPAGRSKAKRMMLYLSLPLCWAPLCCLLASSFASAPNFAFLALLLMAPVPWIYLYERARTFAGDLQGARNFIADQERWTLRWSGPLQQRLA